MKTLLFLTLALLPPITHAEAWDDQGHMIVAAIAYDKLMPQVRDTVIGLLSLNPQYATWVAGIPDDEKPRVAFLRASR